MKNNSHPLQSKNWGKFRNKCGVKTIFIENLLLSIHPIPHTIYTIGYLPKGPEITKDMLSKLDEIGKKEHCVFIQIEPNVEKGLKKYSYNNLKLSAHPLFTKYTFILDLTKSEEEILKNMHPKTRYNIKIAQKKGVRVVEDNSESAFKNYLKLTKETTTRQKFYAHTDKYHKLMWETLKTNDTKYDTNTLTAHLLKATYNQEVLATWIVFVYKDTLYYPYGASSSQHREVMASNLMMWEAIRYGKRLGLKNFDMWGALSLNPDTKDPWYGFHKFKQGFGGKHIEFEGSFDYVIYKNLYQIYKIVDKIRWGFLKLRII